MVWLKLKLFVIHHLGLLAIVGGALALVIASSTMTIYLTSEKTEPVLPQTVFAGRDFRLTPFHLMDARDVCLNEAQTNMGALLLSSALDNRSTYHDPRRDIYVVVMKLSVGDSTSAEEVVVYCNVDPKQQLIVYYKELYPNRGSILSRTMDFFSKLM